MPVAQLGQHVGAEVEQLHAVARVDAVQPRGVGVVHGVPVDALVVEVAIARVDDVPQGFEVALGGIVECPGLVHARGEEEGKPYEDE